MSLRRAIPESNARQRVGNLPRELTSFVGRQHELMELCAALPAAGLVTLVGPGGVGKTRLALRAAEATRTQYASGAWLVELAHVADPQRVVPATADALDIRERPGWNALNTLRQVLRERQVLLVLDNCEHVLQPCAELAAALLQSCDNLSILATSREPLGVPGEVVYPVLPLPTPRTDESLEQLTDCEAIQLLLARVNAIQPSFRLSESSASVAAQICRLVDGLPLAIELAASRASTLSLAEIADRLEDPLRLLTIGPRTAPLRQQTLRATIDWSYGLLTEAERGVFRRLAVFNGGCTFSAVAAVCEDRDSGSTGSVEVLDRLVRQSFVIADTRGEQTRFSQLETVRQYCFERLEQAHETREIRERHRDWCLALVRGAPPPEAFDTAYVTSLSTEMDNLRTALGWTLETGQVEAAARLALGVTAFWHLRGSYSEGRAALTAVTQLARDGAATPEIANAATWAADMAANQGDYLGAEELLERAVDLARLSRDEDALLFAENQQGWIAFMRGDVARARELYERTYQVVSRTAEPLHLVSRYQLALACIEQRDRQRAFELLENFSEAAGASRSGIWVGRLRHAEALLAEQAGDYELADRLFEEAIECERAIDDQPGLLRSLTLRGAVAARRGNRPVAAAALADALQVGEVHASKLHLAHLFEALANLLVDSDLTACVHLSAAAAQLRTTLGTAPAPSEQARVGRYLEAAKQRIGERAYADIWTAAQDESLDNVLHFAREHLQALAETAPGSPANLRGEALSGREMEVAALVTRGDSNREIAEELVISLKTVEAHIHHILNKLGLSNRVQIATWGMRHAVGPARQTASA